tara:strand:+ start:488 stop:745 length:258 start_codon:yes stop_codon:yes gene_type:complete
MSKKKESHGKLGGNLEDVHMNKDAAEVVEHHYNQIDMQRKIRREQLDELWSSSKVNHEGHWYIKLNDVINIISDYNDLYENESKS